MDSWHGNGVTEINWRDYPDTSKNREYFNNLYDGLKAMNTDEIIKFVNGKLEQNHFYISKSKNICILIDLPHGGGEYSIIQINR